MNHKLWTFKVIGGETFHFQVPGNPSIHHDGILSVFNLMLTGEQAEQVTGFIQDQGCGVAVKVPEGESPEQKAERRALVGLGQEDRTWPTAQCPSCFWFDPLRDDPCGFESWSPEAVHQSLISHEKAREGLRLCPLEKSPDE